MTVGATCVSRRVRRGSSSYTLWTNHEFSVGYFNWFGTTEQCKILWKSLCPVGRAGGGGGDEGT